MTTVTTLEAQARLPQLLASVALGEEVLITDGGLPLARLSQPDIHRPTLPVPARASEADTDEDDDRPWRGVFAIESPGEPYPDGQLHLSDQPVPPAQQPADIYGPVSSAP
jgi:antitoxin (DNA-binding transcriptional repressor) of toxin-antitoxin stability system